MKSDYREIDIETVYREAKRTDADEAWNQVHEYVLGVAQATKRGGFTGVKAEELAHESTTNLWARGHPEPPFVRAYIRRVVLNTAISTVTARGLPALSLDLDTSDGVDHEVHALLYDCGHFATVDRPLPDVDCVQGLRLLGHRFRAHLPEASAGVHLALQELLAAAGWRATLGLDPRYSGWQNRASVLELAAARRASPWDVTCEKVSFRLLPERAPIAREQALADLNATAVQLAQRSEPHGATQDVGAALRRVIDTPTALGPHLKALAQPACEELEASGNGQYHWRVFEELCFRAGFSERGEALAQTPSEHQVLSHALLRHARSSELGLIEAILAEESWLPWREKTLVPRKDIQNTKNHRERKAWEQIDDCLDGIMKDGSLSLAERVNAVAAVVFLSPPQRRLKDLESRVERMLEELS